MLGSAGYNQSPTGQVTSVQLNLLVPASARRNLKQRPPLSPSEKAAGRRFDFNHTRRGNGPGHSESPSPPSTSACYFNTDRGHQPEAAPGSRLQAQAAGGPGPGRPGRSGPRVRPQAAVPAKCSEPAGFKLPWMGGIAGAADGAACVPLNGMSSC
jgi:hypothetical protein